MSTRRYLVTGGLGCLGAPLVRALYKAGHEVRVFDDASRGSAQRLGDLAEAVRIIHGDIRDAQALYQAMRGVDGVWHLAYVNGTASFYDRPAYVLDVGVKGIVNVLDGCTRAQVGELILASSSEVYQSPPSLPTDESAPLSIPDPFNPRYSYGAGKIISEVMAIHFAREHLERLLIFRPHNVFGPDMGSDHVVPQFIQRLRRLQATAAGAAIPFPIQGTGNETRAFVYIEDFIAGLLLILERGQHLNIYNVGTSEEISVRDLACRVAHCLGVEIEVVPGLPAAGGTARRCPDITKLQRLGYQPRVSFDDGLRRTTAWYLAHEPAVPGHPLEGAANEQPCAAGQPPR